MTYTIPASIVPAFLDDIAPEVADARAAADAARATLKAAQAAVRPAREALTALSTVSHPGPVYAPRPDVKTADHDKARAAFAAAEDAFRLAQRTDVRTAEKLRDVAAAAVQRPDVVAALDALAADVEARTATTYAAFRAALADRDDLDVIRRVRTLQPEVAGRLVGQVKSGNLARVEYRDALGEGRSYLLAQVEKVAAPARVVGGALQ